MDKNLKIKIILSFLLLAGITYLFIFLGFSWIISIFLSLTFLFIYDLIRGRKLALETFRTMINSLKNQKKYEKIIEKYMQQGEKLYLSPKINFNGKDFFVARYSKSFIPIVKEEGIIIFNKEHPEEISPEEAIGVKRIFKIWKDIYFYPIFFEDFKDGSFKEVLFRDPSKDLSPWNIKKFKKIQSHEIYSFLTAKTNLNKQTSIEELKELNNLTLEQHESLSILSKEIIEIAESLFNFFEKPSEELYNNLINKCKKLEDLYNKRNFGDNLKKRVLLWEKIQDSKEIKKTRDGFILIFIADLLQFLTKNSIPFGGILIKILEGIVNLNIKLYNYLKKWHFSYQRFGIDAVNQALNMEKGIKKSVEKYNELIDDNSLLDVRNMQSI